MRINWEDGERPLIIARLGLDESASDEQIAQGMTSLLTAAETPPVETPPPADNPPAETPPVDEDDDDDDDAPEDIADPTEGMDDADTITMDVAAFRAIRESANLTARLREEDRIKTREILIAGAIKDGKFPPSRKKHYTARYDSDPESTQKLIAKMAKGMVPVEERGVDAADDEMETSDAYPADWVPDVAARANNNGGAVPQQAQGQPVQVPVRRSRVQTED